MIRMCLVAAMLFSVASAVRASTVTVFAAASLTDAMTAIAQSFAAATGDRLRLSFAASSTLARQIAAGAPADLYISANRRWMSWLAWRTLLAPDSRHDLLTNDLVLIAPLDSPLGSFDMTAKTDLAGLLGDRDYIAVGDPDHVPAGIYAKQALESLGQWKTIEPHLARADNVRAALALVERGEASLGIVYKTDAAIARDIKVLASFPRDSHSPIAYPVALIRGHETPASIQCLTWLLGDEAGAIFSRYGFERPATDPKRGDRKK
ncbi:MAG: molybdate ABC transporter substrate-binding protein [Hyphomicrobiales bacterium]